MPRQMPTTLGPRIRAQARGGSLPLTFQIGSRGSKERKVESVKRKVVDLFSASDTRTCVAKRLHSFTLYVLHFTLSLRLRDANHLVYGDRFRVIATMPGEVNGDRRSVVACRGFEVRASDGQLLVVRRFRVDLEQLLETIAAYVDVVNQPFVALGRRRPKALAVDLPLVS